MTVFARLPLRGHFGPAVASYLESFDFDMESAVLRASYAVAFAYIS